MIIQKKSKYLMLTALVATLCLSRISYAQTDASKVKALWVHTLISYIKWGDDEDNSNKTICTRGLDRTYNFLKEIQEEKKTSYNFIEIGSNADLQQCNFLYIATSEINNISSILSGSESKKIVTVSDIKGFAQDGGMIELSHNEGVVKLKINVKVAKQSGIIINSDLLAVSEVIQ
jgi:hypothetical protein